MRSWHAGPAITPLLGNVMESKTTRVLELDGLRGIAVLLVIFFHYAPGMAMGGPFFHPGAPLAYVIAPIIRLGWSGVDLFFVLSGFLICNILISTRNAPNGLITFYARRAGRILPLYSILLLLFIVGIVLERTGIVHLPRLFGDVRQIWPYLTFMQNNAYAFFGHEFNFLTPSWSLAIEEQFYFCFPLIVTLLTSRSRLLAALITMMAVSVLCRTLSFFLPLYAPADWRWAFTLCRLDAIAIGAIIAVALSDARWRKYLEQRRNWLLAAIPILALGALAEAKWEGILGAFLYIWFALLYGAVLLLAVLGHPITAVLRSRFLKFFGDISYGLYLLHIPALGLVTGILWSSDADFLDVRPISCTLIGLALCVILAIASFHLFEQPILSAVHRRYTYRASKDRAPQLGCKSVKLDLERAS
jgi:peptidoglycan/LPS O-acetylase OafA/YrhL